MTNIAIIPARGGSKRIPRKNIKNFLGKPIIVYSIEAAVQSGLFDEIIVSTDDNEIADIAIKNGVKVLKRSDHNSNDYATLSDVIEEVKSVYDQKNLLFNNICCILATAPLITANLIKEGHTTLTNTESDSVRPVVRFSYPIQRAFSLENGKVSFLNPEHTKTRSQDLEPAFYDAGMFYWMRWNLALKGLNKYAFEISEMQAQDIDTNEDWLMAELKYQLNNK